MMAAILSLLSLVVFGYEFFFISLCSFGYIDVGFGLMYVHSDVLVTC